MVRVKVTMKFKNEPAKRTPVLLYLDRDPDHPVEVATDREGVATFDMPPASGKVVIGNAIRYHGLLTGDIEVSLWSLTEGDSVSDHGTPDGSSGGSTAYPGMKTRSLQVNGKEVLTDSEGYLVNLDDWSEAFVRAEAEYEGLELNDEHWEIIRFLRDSYEKHGVQANVRDIIKHYRVAWGPERGNNHYLHDIFPRGGPQKQGNRLAGLLRVKGEH